MASTLEQLKKVTTVVADTPDFESMVPFKPTDATTNPSIILAAIKKEKYAHLVDKAINYAKKISSNLEEQLDAADAMTSVLCGLEILKYIPGRISTELDSRDSFNVEKTIEKGRQIIQLYEEAGVNKERVMIKLGATWEGIQAAKVLEGKYGIRCNLTLVFSFAQAVACAEAGVTLISPFVGRIMEWYVENTDKKTFTPQEDPGVLAVKKIYNYYRKFGYNTEILGASFRNIGQIVELGGVDLVTLSTKLLQELADTNIPVKRNLNVEDAKRSDLKKISLNEEQFRWALTEDKMGTDTLCAGIRRFTADSRKIEKILLAKLAE